MVFVRIQALTTIGMMTGFLCVQDYIKKSIVVTNFTQAMLTKNKSDDIEDGQGIK